MSRSCQFEASHPESNKGSYVIVEVIMGIGEAIDRLTLGAAASSLMYESPMKGGSVDLAACVGRWDFSVVGARLLGLSKVTDARGTLSSAVRGAAAVDFFKTCMVGLCWCCTLAGG